VDYLERLRVEVVFGVPGGAVEPIYNALARSERRGGPRSVVARHEAGAAFMADGYARGTGKLGVCIATSGPGATNLITGVACAHANKVPMLVITGQPPIHSFGKGALQESACTGINTIGMFRLCTRYNSLVSHPDQLETKLINAVMQATQGAQGPAHLSIPVDILRSPVRRRAPELDPVALLSTRPALIDLEAVRRVRDELVRSSNPVFLVGAGAGEAIERIMELVSLANARFVTTPDAKGYVNPRHHAFRGAFGFGGHASAEAALREADLVLAFGTGFSELSSGGWSSALMSPRLVHIDPLEEHLMRSPMARLHVRGHLPTVCEHLAGLLAAEAPLRVLEGPDTAGHVCHPEVTLHAREQFDSDATPIKPQRLMRELSRRFPPTTRFLADVGNSMIWAVHYLQPQNRRDLRSRRPAVDAVRRANARSGTASWLRTVMDFAPMGWAIGAAVGLARGTPSSPVVCITGDGSYLMSGQEITVAAQEGLTVVFVVLNDSAYGMVMHGQRLAKAEPVAFELPQVDYRRLAESLGVPGHVIESPDDFDALDIEAILARGGPTLLDVRIDREEVPPMIQRLKALGAVS